mmetsp:Transcript_2446/g.8789  ORF Transcript_2446/g.8789 Transcript_2446/m.8789 type:complete len:469 (-) Transcript_2446:312-1718(-)
MAVAVDKTENYWSTEEWDELYQQLVYSEPSNFVSFSEPAVATEGDTAENKTEVKDCDWLGSDSYFTKAEECQIYQTLGESNLFGPSPLDVIDISLSPNSTLPTQLHDHVFDEHPSPLTDHEKASVSKRSNEQLLAELNQSRSPASAARTDVVKSPSTLHPFPANMTIQQPAKASLKRELSCASVTQKPYEKTAPVDTGYRMLSRGSPDSPPSVSTYFHLAEDSQHLKALFAESANGGHPLELELAPRVGTSNTMIDDGDEDGEEAAEGVNHALQAPWKPAVKGNASLVMKGTSTLPAKQMAPNTPPRSAPKHAKKLASSTSSSLAGRGDSAQTTVPLRKGRSRKWTEDEDEAVKRLVAKYGAGNWVRVAGDLTTKTPKQVHARWRDYLRPGISDRPWTDAETRKLATLHRKIGNQWSQLALQMPGRSANAIKNRVNAARRRRRNNGNPELIALWSYLHEERNTAMATD